MSATGKPQLCSICLESSVKEQSLSETYCVVGEKKKTQTERGRLGMAESLKLLLNNGQCHFCSYSIDQSKSHGQA